MSDLEKDIQAARKWLGDVAIEAMRIAMTHENTATRLVDKVVVISYCAELPGDMALRVRLTPNVFKLKA